MSKNIAIKKGECDSEIIFADDFGDNPCTFHCQLKNGHRGKHRAVGIIKNELSPFNQPWTLEWNDNYKKFIKKNWRL